MSRWRDRMGWTWAATLATAVMGSSALAAEPFMTPERAAIMWEGPSKIDGTAVETLWREFCGTLGERLVARKGPVGAGVFSQVTCVEPGETPPKEARWRVRVRSGEDALAVSARLMIGDKTSKGVARFMTGATVELPPSARSLRGLAAPGVAELLAMKLMDEMPHQWWFTSESLTTDATAVKGTRVTQWIDKDRVPAELALYRLRVDTKRSLWVPVYLGRAVLTGFEGGAPMWRVTPEIASAIRRGGAWGLSAIGRGAFASDYELAVRRAYEQAAGVGTTAGDQFFKSFLTQATRHNRVGGRYGMSILPGDALIRKQKAIGFFADIQHGPYAGWRLFVDRVPKVNITENGSDLSLGSDRYLIGFALSIAPGFLVQRVDVTPRVGYWSMRAVVPVSEDSETGDTVTRAFDVSRAGSGGIEAGVELGDDNNAVRLWYSMDRGVNVVGSSQGSARATRWGVDVFLPLFRVGRLGETELRLLTQAFAFVETVELSDPDADQTDSVAVGSIGYTDGFLGAGVGVTW